MRRIPKLTEAAMRHFKQVARICRMVSWLFLSLGPGPPWWPVLADDSEPLFIDTSGPGGVYGRAGV
jgi:hypothetical protein